MFDLSRREFLGRLAAAAAVGAAWITGDALGLPETRVLRLRHQAERAAADLVYRRDGVISPAAVAAFSLLLRDRRAGAAVAMPVELMERLWWLQESLRMREPVIVVSGYRTPETNAWLAATHEGVAQRSLHIEGVAVDVRFPGVAPGMVAEIARFLGDAMGSGGIGEYASFSHVDCGRRRDWRG